MISISKEVFLFFLFSHCMANGLVNKISEKIFIQQGKTMINLFLGNNELLTLFMINIHSKLNILSSDELDEKNRLSLTEISNDTIQHNNQELKATLLEDYLKFPGPGFSIGTYRFYEIKNYEEKNVISLSYTTLSNQKNLVDILIKNGNIKKKCFGFTGENFKKGYFRGLIHFGGLPEDYIEKKPSAKCHVNGENWGCKLNAVFSINDGIVEKYYNSKGFPAYFQTETSQILVPSSFMKFLYSSVLEIYFKKDFCWVNEKEITCYCELIKDFPKLRFEFDGVQFILAREDMFWDDYSDFCEFIFEENTEDIWIFGNSFIRQYTTLFDYEDQSISFFGLLSEDSDESVSQVKESKRTDNTRCVQILFSLVILFMLLGMLLVLKRK